VAEDPFAVVVTSFPVAVGFSPVTVVGVVDCPLVSDASSAKAFVLSGP